MEINGAILERKRQELVEALAKASSQTSGEILVKFQKLLALQTSYEELCAQFDALFAIRPPFIELTVTDGALSENYLNLHEAVAQGLVSVGQTIRLSFPGTALESVTSDIKSNGYLRDRASIRLFYECANIRNTGKRIRFTKIDRDEYAVEDAASPEHRAPASAPAGRLPPFSFSKCGLRPGDQIAFLDDPGIVCTVCDDRHVIYDGQRYSLSPLAQKLRGTRASLAGPRFFTYRGERLCDRRERLEASE